MMDQIQVTPQGFKLLGVLNFDAVMPLYKRGITLLDHCEHVLVDFSEVSHADSSAIALLLSWLRYAKQHNKTLIFANLPNQLLEICNVCEVMPFLQQHIGRGAHSYTNEFINQPVNGLDIAMSEVR